MAQASTERHSRSVRPLQRHKGLIALTTAAVALSALFASLAQQKVYRATAVVAVGSSPAGQPRLTVAGEAAALRSDKVRSAVAARGGTPKAVTVKTDGGNQIEVTAQAKSAGAAASLANGYVGVYIGQRQEDLTVGPSRDLRSRINDLQKQIDAMTVEISQAKTAVVGTLAQRRDGLVRQRDDLQHQLDALAAGRTSLTVSRASAPGGPSQPHPARSFFIALIVGLGLGILLALILEILERRAADYYYEEPMPTTVFTADAPVPDPEPWPGSPDRTAKRQAPRPQAPPQPPTPAQPLAQSSRAQPPPATQAPPPPPPPQPQVQAPPPPQPQPSPPQPEPATAEAQPMSDVESAAERSGPGVPVLGMIPAVAAWRGRERPLLRRDQPTTPSAEAYRNLAATVQRLLPHRPLRSLVVTSPTHGDGKTTIAANLGVVLARAGKTVVVVDCELRRARLHELFGLRNEAGFTSVLRGEAPLSRATQDIPDEPRLQLLSAGPPPMAPGQLLSAQRTMEVLTALQAQADILVIDVPAVEPSGDAAVVASIVDAALVIAGAPSGQAADLARAVDQLDTIDGLVVGVVLNAVDDPDTDGRMALLRRDTPRVSLA